MPFDAAVPPQPLNIAVVGTGIAGMSAAWLLSKSHTVTVYEQDRRIGGHTNTVEVPDLNGPIPVDTGFIVYNEVGTLSEREAKVLRLYFGLGETEPLTLEQIGERFGITRERVRQIKERALSRLRHQSRARFLETFLT
jgi:protoporphyrinogen oxidase